VNRFRRLLRFDTSRNRPPILAANQQTERSLKPILLSAIRAMAPTLLALSFAGVAHAQGTMDFSGAQTLMGTFKTFAIYAGAVICFGGLIFAGIRMMSGRFQDAIPGLFGALFGAGVLGWGAGWIGSKNPLVLGFQGKAQLEVIYGHLAEVMLSQPATKIFMKTAEPKAAEWISEAIGKVEIERLKETKFDGSRSGKNFTVERQIEPLVMGSEITGLDDRHAYLKLGNNVARFAFDYLDLPTPTPGFLPRHSPDGEMSFDPDTLEPRSPKASAPKKHPEPAATTDAAQTMANDAPLVLEKSPIQWPRKDVNEQVRAGDGNRPEPAATVVSDTDTTTEQEELHGPEYVREL